MKKNISSFGLLIFVGYMWWGFVYPEFSFIEGTFEIVGEADTESDEEADTEDKEAGKKSDFATQHGWCSLLETEPDKIVFRSKIVRKWMQ